MAEQQSMEDVVLKRIKDIEDGTAKNIDTPQTLEDFVRQAIQGKQEKVATPPKQLELPL